MTQADRHIHRIGCRQGNKCPYCLDVILPGSGYECEGCHTLFHSECWNEHGGCSTMGCDNMVVVYTKVWPRPKFGRDKLVYLALFVLWASFLSAMVILLLLHALKKSGLSDWGF